LAEKGQTMGFEDMATALVATAAKIARQQDLALDADVLESSSASLIQTGSNEDFGQTYEYYTLMLEVPIPMYVAVDEVRSRLEKRIHNRIDQLVRTERTNRITEVVISPVLAERSRPPSPTPQEGAQEEEPPSFWQPGCFRLFISHTSANKVKAHALKQALAEYHVAAFVAHDDIVPTREWEAEIERALRTTDALAAIMTPDFVESRWCDQEVGFAIGRGKLVIPLCSDTIPHGFLSKYQSFKAKGLLAAAVAEQLFNVLLAHTLTSQRMTDALVDRMANSGSFEISRRTMPLLEKIARLNDSQVTKLVQSTDTNRQVREAVGIPLRIQRLVARVGKSNNPQ
jgi:hypothetical protein